MLCSTVRKQVDKLNNNRFYALVRMENMKKKKQFSCYDTIILEIRLKAHAFCFSTIPYLLPDYISRRRK